MIIDIAEQIGATSREVSRQHTESGETVAVTLQRRYLADPADVWEAITDPERVRRWFMPLTGDLREGGNFQLEGNASGDILKCEPPRHLMVTFGGASSIVDVQLSGESQQTLLKLTHSVPIELAGSGAGALYVGPGWDGALMGIAVLVRSPKIWLLQPIVLRYKTSMSVRSRSGSPRLKPRGLPTLMRFQPRSRSPLRSLRQIWCDPTEMPLLRRFVKIQLT